MFLLLYVSLNWRNLFLLGTVLSLKNVKYLNLQDSLFSIY